MHKSIIHSFNSYSSLVYHVVPFWWQWIRPMTNVTHPVNLGQLYCKTPQAEIKCKFELNLGVLHIVYSLFVFLKKKKGQIWYGKKLLIDTGRSNFVRDKLKLSSKILTKKTFFRSHDGKKILGGHQIFLGETPSTHVLVEFTTWSIIIILMTLPIPSSYTLPIEMYRFDWIRIQILSLVNHANSYLFTVRN